MANPLNLNNYENWIGDGLYEDYTSIVNQHPEYDFSDNTKRKGVSRPKIGMNELTGLVLNLKRDIKKISDAQSLQGAQRVAQKLGKGYSASDADINGDGIPDVVISDRAGRPVVVNGYTTTKSDFPYKYMYYTAYPTRADRKNKPFNDYIREQNNPKYEDPNNPMLLTSSETPEGFIAAARNGYRSKVPRNRTVYNVFTSDIIKPILDEVQAEMNISEKRALISVSAFCWNYLVVFPCLKACYKQAVLPLIASMKAGTTTEKEKKQLSKLKAKKVFKDLVSSTVRRIYYSEQENKNAIIRPIVQVSMNMYLNKVGLSLPQAQQNLDNSVAQLMNAAESGYNTELPPLPHEANETDFLE